VREGERQQARKLRRLILTLSLIMG